MKRIRKLWFKLYKFRQDWRRTRRLKFPSPAEVEFIRIMGGKYVTISWLRDPMTGFPYTRILTLGSILKREGIEREVRAGAMFIDFATVDLIYNKAIEIDGTLFHMDIVKEQERDEYLWEHGQWQVLHINAAELYREPTRVQQRVLKFLAA